MTENMQKRSTFFGLRYSDPPQTPVYLDQLGAQIKLAGVLFQGNGQEVLLMMPGHERLTPEDGPQFLTVDEPLDAETLDRLKEKFRQRHQGRVVVLHEEAEVESPLPETVTPTIEEWIEILRATDDPQIFETDESGAVKAVHRKSARAIGGALRWEIWRRDGFKCMFCGREGGVDGVQLTADHFWPVEKGGTDERHNLISACNACNKDKGSRDPQTWLDPDEYAFLSSYLARFEN